MIFSIMLSGWTSASAQRSRNLFRSPVAKQTGTTPTGFASVSGYSDGNGAWLEWQMTAEQGNAGFFIYRIDANGKHLVSDSLINGSAMHAGNQPLYGEKYSFFDVNGTIGALYYVESVSLSGKRLASRTFVPEYTSSLKAVTGYSSSFLVNREQAKSTNAAAIDLNLPSEIVNERQSQSVGSDIDQHRFVISQPGAKIAVKRTGFYHITKAELEAGGFNTGGDPADWQLYLDGIEQAINVGPNGDFIEFFGHGINTVESDTQIYFLINGISPGKRIGVRSAGLNRGTVISRNYNQSSVVTEKVNYINQIRNGDLDNYWGRTITSVPTTVSFTLTGIDTNQPDTNLDLKLQGFSFGSHEVRVVLNGNLLPSVKGLGQLPLGNKLTIPTSILREGSNDLELTSVGPAGDFSFFDTISLGFGRKFLAEDGTLSFFTLSNRSATISGFTDPNFRVFDVTFDHVPVAISNLTALNIDGGFGVKMPASRAHVYYAVQDSAMLSPVSIVPNKPEMLGVPSLEADLIIIAYRDFLTEAEAWADFRRNQGFKVKVVDVEEIFDEFNFGVLSADSIKSFLNFAYNNWAVQPKYVLLLGDASFDSRNYQGLGFFNLVPTKLVNTVFTETGSDETLADFDDDGLAEMAVGRIPARDGQFITNMLAKTANWEQNLISPARGALFAHDVIDAQGLNFGEMSIRLKDQLGPDFPPEFVSRGDADSQNVLISKMNTGKYVVNYSGHGSIGVWASVSFFGSPSVPSLNNAGKESIYTMLTCLNGFFLNVSGSSLGENLISATNGGAIVVWSSTGLTTADVQEVMGQRFYNQLGAGNLTRMGDLIKDAKTVIPFGRDVRLSWALLGDPMLKVR